MEVWLSQLELISILPRISINMSVKLAVLDLNSTWEFVENFTVGRLYEACLLPAQFSTFRGSFTLENTMIQCNAMNTMINCNEYNDTMQCNEHNDKVMHCNEHNDKMMRCNAMWLKNAIPSIHRIRIDHNFEIVTSLTFQVSSNFPFPPPPFIGLVNSTGEGSPVECGRKVEYNYST